MIEHSIDGRQYRAIDTVMSKGENGASYQYISRDANSGLNLYRIRQVDKDGSNTFAPIVSATLRGALQIKLFPNPTVDEFTLSLGNRVSGAEKIVATGIGGQQVFQQRMNEGNTTLVNTRSWSTGMYVVNVLDATGKTIYSKKVMKK